MTEKNVQFFKILAFSLILLSFWQCKEDHNLNDACTPGTPGTCPEGLVCEETLDGEPACFEPVVIRGRVFELGTDMGIPDARVVARDANGAALGTAATSDTDGSYALPVLTTRINDKGEFDGASLTLRADAAGYASYPGGFRPSLPVDLDDAVFTDGKEGIPSEYRVETPTTDVALIPLPEDISDFGSISGTVPDGRGALIVAEGPSTVTGIADASGAYTIFNVPAGGYSLNAYIGGRQYSPLTVDVIKSQQVLNADFQPLKKPFAEVDGNVNIVNAPGGSVTSVVLVVESTFSDTFMRGEVPPGLRAGDVTGAFTISQVPDGKYAVLAAFENDNLVRDPDTSIAGTQIVHIEVTGDSVNLSESFKITEALEIKSPGAEAPEALSGTPVFTWADDSSQDAYQVIVYDAFGATVWEDNSLGAVTGEQWVTLEYGGPALKPGLYYQWRAVSIKDKVPISSTEDLRGLFFIK